MDYLGSNIKFLRNNRKLSQAALGKMIGVSGAYIQQIEKGYKKNPSFALIYDICEIFDVSPMGLLETDLSNSDFFDFAESTELSTMLRNFCLNKDKELGTDIYFDNLFKRPSETREYDFNIIHSDSLHLTDIIENNKDNEISTIVRQIIDNLFLSINNLAKDKDIETLNSIYSVYRSIWSLIVNSNDKTSLKKSLAFLDINIKSLIEMNSNIVSKESK
ncbi:helix-turn-helix transcriptional regulator [Clostridium sp. UBA5712]|uniref:helix-turn-helix domain-containing protein n=1 Tax=Clostridium sp. UBA5712 TaxID=1946368 RepID=UPI003216BE8B